MSVPQNFRSAFNGFNREDVVHYLEYLNTRHQNQVNQLSSELEELRAQLEAQNTQSDLSQELEALRAQCQELTAQLEEAQTALAQKEATPSQPEPVNDELATYRRAQTVEREAQERAELVYYQASGVLTEATAKVDSLSGEITELTDQVLRQLTQLQVAVSGSKRTLQDAASIMKAIRPNH